MSNMINFGNGLQKKYLNNAQSELLSNSAKSQLEKDREALKKVANAKREARMAKMEVRDENRVSLDVKLENEVNGLGEKMEQEIKSIEENAEREVSSRIQLAKEKTNVLAREYGLPEPNNPEALIHDRYHCMKCDRKLHNPDAHKGTPLEGIIDDADIRLMCCWCFGKMGEEQIKNTMRKNAEATKEIRLAVYNPESIVDTKIDISGKIQNVEKMTKEYEIYLKAKIKKYQNVVNMIGNIKYDKVEEMERFENQVMYRAPTRYTACAGGL